MSSYQSGDRSAPFEDQRDSDMLLWVWEITETNGGSGSCLEMLVKAQCKFGHQ